MRNATYVKRSYESWVIDDGNHVMVPNLNKMISIITRMTRANAQMPKP
jgi:hypothetical protein